MQSGEFKHAHIGLYAEGVCLDLVSHFFSQHFCLLVSASLSRPLWSRQYGTLLQITCQVRVEPRKKRQARSARLVMRKARRRKGKKKRLSHLGPAIALIKSHFQVLSIHRHSCWPPHQLHTALVALARGAWLRLSPPGSILCWHSGSL